MNESLRALNQSSSKRGAGKLVKELVLDWTSTHCFAPNLARVWLTHYINRVLGLSLLCFECFIKKVLGSKKK